MYPCEQEDNSVHGRNETIGDCITIFEDKLMTFHTTFP